MNEIIKDRYLSGQSTPEIAAALSMSTEAVRKSLMTLGIPRRGRRLPVDPRFHDLYRAMVPQEEIAKQLGVSIRVIKRWIAVEGVARSRSTMNSNAKNTPSVSKVDLAQALKESKYNLTSVGRSLGISRATVRTWMRKYGLMTPARPQQSELEQFAERTKDLAACYNVTLSTARRWLDKHQIKRARRELPECPADFEQSFLLGTSRGQLAKQYGVTYPTISRWVTQQSLTRRFPLKLRPPDPQEITRLYRDEKLSTAAIGSRYGVSDVTVQKWLANIGVERNLGFVSVHEDEVLRFVNSQGGCFTSSRKVLSRNRELDGYDDTRKMAIEYCGLWWHCEAMGKSRTYHINKFRECTEGGISLFTIFQDEWTERRTQVEAFLRARLGDFDTRIGARKCEVICDADPSVLQEWHLQGRPRRITESFGLVADGEQVGIVTFAPHHRGSDTLTLNRLAFRPGVQIIGGASKLVKHALRTLKQPVVTWSDNRWSTGELYRSVGFTFDGDLGPDYSYTNGNVRRTKQSCKKSLIGCPPDITEREFMAEKGWFRIWDCGKRRWMWRP